MDLFLDISFHYIEFHSFEPADIRIPSPSHGTINWYQGPFLLKSLFFSNDSAPSAVEIKTKGVIPKKILKIGSVGNRLRISRRNFNSQIRKEPGFVTSGSDDAAPNMGWSFNKSMSTVRIDLQMMNKNL